MTLWKQLKSLIWMNGKGAREGEYRSRFTSEVFRLIRFEKGILSICAIWEDYVTCGYALLHSMIIY